MTEVASDARVMVDVLLREAAARRASDVHVEPTADGYIVKARVDGLLEDLRQLNTDAGRGVVNRLMVAAKLLTYRLDVPQEGRCQLAVEVGGEPLDLRVSVIPTNHGLRAAVRLPAELIQPRTLDGLGLPDAVLDALKHYAAADSGMLLLCGPAGSGKTTTVYALLDAIVAASRGVSVVALEDPIERDLPGVTQVQVTPFGELTYERALRSMLRQDPQVLSLGEIRDADTASVAVQATLSGHRLISTLHAATPAGAMVRLLEMGVAGYQITAALHGVVAMRLLRKSDGQGGYAGRLPVASVALMNDAVRTAVLQGGDSRAIEEAIAEQGSYATLHDTASGLVEQGLTDEAEVDRVFGKKAE